VHAESVKEMLDTGLRKIIKRIFLKSAIFVLTAVSTKAHPADGLSLR
jgi:hypothetical protein